MQQKVQQGLTNDQVRALAYMEEFKAMRREIQIRVTEVYRLSYVYIAFLVAMVVVALAVFKNPSLLVLVTGVTPLFAFNHISRDREIRRLGLYIGTRVKPELERLLQGDVALTWEIENADYYGRPFPRILHKLNPLGIFLMPALVAGVLAESLSALDFLSWGPVISASRWLLFFIGLSVALNMIWVIFWLSTKDPFEEYAQKGTLGRGVKASGVCR